MTDTVQVKVDLYKASGKWAYGGLVSVPFYMSLGSVEHKQALIDNQHFVQDGAFEYHTVVVSHLDSYDNDPRQYFFQHLYHPGAFTGLRKRT